MEKIKGEREGMANVEERRYHEGGREEEVEWQRGRRCERGNGMERVEWKMEER